jgi:signal transduction histidine kinase
VQAIHSHPEFHPVRITISQEGNGSGWFDPKKLERALYNLLLNSCEAIVPEAGGIKVELAEVRGGVEIRVCDNGRGIPELIRGKLFEPFVSCGKENGTGLGLTVVQKIVQDHGGDVTMEKTSAEGTVFRLLLPLVSSFESVAGGREQGNPGRPPLARTE